MGARDFLIELASAKFAEKIPKFSPMANVIIIVQTRLIAASPTFYHCAGPNDSID